MLTLMVIQITGKHPVSKEGGKEDTYVFDYKNFCSNHFCSNICQVELYQRH